MTMTSGIDITDILRVAADQGASDVILAAGLPPQFKLSGTYDSQGFEALSPTDTRKLMYSMMNERQQRTFEEKRELDFSFALGDKARFRVNTFMQRGNVGGVMRLIPTTVRTIAEMGLPQTVIDIASAPRGLVLVTGADGVGQIDHPGVDDRPHQHHQEAAHPDHRRPHRVHAPQQGQHHQPARGRGRHPEFRRRAAGRAAAGPPT